MYSNFRDLGIWLSYKNCVYVCVVRRYICIVSRSIIICGIDRKVWLQNVGISDIIRFAGYCKLYKKAFLVNHMQNKLYTVICIYVWDGTGEFVLILYNSKVTITMEWIVRYLRVLCVCVYRCVCTIMCILH
jgi:hypothetical protein